MKLEDYFDFLADDDIRIKNSRMVKSVLYEYIYRGQTAEQIAERFLSLEQIHATTLYYLSNYQYKKNICLIG